MTPAPSHLPSHLSAVPFDLEKSVHKEFHSMLFRGGSRGVTRVTSHPPGAAAYFMLFFALKQFIHF